LDMASDTVKERVELFKELIKRGYSVSKARRESKLHPREYKKYYDEIWSDPDMKPYMPQRAFQRASEKPPTIEETEKRLAELGLLTRTSEYQSQLEREVDELELKRQSLLRAAEKAYRLFGGGVPGASQRSTPTVSETGETPRDIVEEFEAAFRDFEAKRARIKEVLEKLGFRIEDVYMRRDEVERIVDEVKRRTAEEAIDDKRIEAVENIIRDAVARLIELFKPAVQAFLTAPEASESGEERGAEGGASEPQ